MRLLFFLILLSASTDLCAQDNLQGAWQGVLIKDGAKESESIIIYLYLHVDGTNVTGTTREEFYKTDYYLIQKTKGSIDHSTIKLKQYNIEKRKISSAINACSVDMALDYVDSTGYLSGRFTGNNCRGNIGRVIFYRCKKDISKGDSIMFSHSWRDGFLTDLKKGRKAPEVQERERRNFKFQPIYFDYDQAEIKPEFTTYLSQMARVVNGHSDLRIRITGHTDADGSDEYNVGLSQRRAKAIQDFFLQRGLESFKLVIDFKGEKMPVDNNNTPEGKQRNRRVDFEFI